MVLDENFKEFIKLLNEKEVKYLIVGGFAVAYHGYPRYTKDLDFWVWADPTNVDRLLEVIKAFGFGSVGLEKEDFFDPDNVIQLGYEPNRIDLLVQLEGLEFEPSFANRVEAFFDGTNISFIGFEDLIQNKLSTGRAKDKLDAKTLDKKAKKRKMP